MAKKDKFMEMMKRNSDNVVKQNCCKKCGGVIVRNWISSTMVGKVGKRCECKNPINK